jgi:hypothetical protein
MQSDVIFIIIAYINDFPDFTVLTLLLAQGGQFYTTG